MSVCVYAHVKTGDRSKQGKDKFDLLRDCL